MYKFENLNSALIGMSKELIKNGVKRKTRGFDCIEMPHPVLICIENPSDRYVTIKERKWNKILPFAESLWLALGINDLNSLPGNYVKNLYNFSDNGYTWRAAYGPRMRSYSGDSVDYQLSDKNSVLYKNRHYDYVDQFKFVIDTLKKDLSSRQALITIHDPVKDDFDKCGNLKITKDQPCTRSVHFQVNHNGELDVITHLRSNDCLWGFSAVNVFNFALMQEYMANILGLKIGNYYHLVDNFHYYENFTDMLKKISRLDITAYQTGEKFQYDDKIANLEEFDSLIDCLYSYEKRLRTDSINKTMFFGNQMFDDWGKVFFKYWTKKTVEFTNPYLEKLFNK